MDKQFTADLYGLIVNWEQRSKRGGAASHVWTMAANDLRHLMRDTCLLQIDTARIDKELTAILQNTKEGR